MSITKQISNELISRAYQITIDKTDSENPRIVFNYTNDEQYLGKQSIDVGEAIDTGLVTAEQVANIEETFRALADNFNPYKPDE